MDTVTTSHMSVNESILSSYFNLSNSHYIIVGNGHTIQVKGLGHTVLSNSSSPLSLNNVLHVSCLIRNHIYVRQFTIDNTVSVEFYSFDFSVKNC